MAARPIGRRRAAVVWGLSLAVGGCDGTQSLGSRPPTSCALLEYEQQASGDPGEIKVATFWNDEAENRAFKRLVTHAEDSPYVVVETGRKDRITQQISLRDWLLNDSEPLPDLFQVNGGSDVLQWADRPPAEETQLCPLDHLAARHDWSQRFFPAALAPLTCNDSLYALPIGVHRLNTLLFDRARLEQLRLRARDHGLRLDLPEDYRDADDFRDALDTIAEIGQRSPADAVVPLAIGNQSGWPLTILGFENLMVSRPSNTYEAVWSPASTPLGLGELRAELEDWLGDLRALTALSNIADRVSWQSAVHMVADGQAAFTVMGDWALAQVSAADAARLETAYFPGTGGAFVYTPDSFAVPRRGASDGSGAHFWLQEIVADEETQLAFSALKQSIPSLRGLTADALSQLGSARLEEQYRAFDECQRPESSCRLLLAVSGLGPPPARDPCFDEIDRLLARAAGAPSQDDLDQAGEASDCDEPLEEDPAAAGRHLIEILLRLSENHFAESCR